MVSLAVRNLFHEKVRLAVTLVGIVFSVILAAVQLGIFLGFIAASTDIIAYSNADLWITSKNVTHVEQGVELAKAGFEGTLPVVENAERETKRSAEMRENFNVVNAAARADDLNKADSAIQIAAAQVKEFDALLAEARARVAVATANLAKTVIRAPVAGVILRKRLKTGESFSPENLRAGIVSIGDVSALRVRVDVDEIDVAKIKAGQTAYVTADAYGDQKFTAKVVRIGQILGRKNVRIEEPTEKVDQKILEILLELEPNQKLPLGLRVDAFIGSE